MKLVEAAPALGGMLRTVARDPNRREFDGFLDGLAARVRDAGVTVTLGERVDGGDVAHAGADVVVLATGSVEWIPPVPGVGDARVTTALAGAGRRRAARRRTPWWSVGATITSRLSPLPTSWRHESNGSRC